MGVSAGEPAEAPASSEEHTPEEGLPHPAAPDLRGSHLLLSVAGVVAVPSADLVPVPAGSSSFGYGGGLRAAVGLGLNRHGVLRLDGGAAWLTGVTRCDSCSALSGDVGLSIAYVLAQGIAFEPWAAYGLGYRYGSSDFATISETAHGLDVARLSLGGDYFPTPSFGFGPVIETDIGLQVSPDTAGYVGFFAGLRATFDFMRAGTDLSSNVARR